MSQRNPMNERYQEEHVGHTRKSAASAKPKSKAAASVTVQKAKKSPEQKKAAQKQARREAKEEQRRIDRMYYNPDTQRYKNLRRGWWACLIGAIASTAVSWFSRSMQPEWLSMVFMVLAYALIIAAFYLDFSKIRKERQAYQERMLALEEKQKKEEKAAARAARSSQQVKAKGSGKNASRNPKTQAKAAAEKAASEAEEAASQDAAEQPGAKPEKKGLFGFGKKKTAQAEEAAKAE